MRRMAVALVLAGALGTAGEAAAQSGGCEGFSLRGAQCGALLVPLDHGNPDGAKLSLSYARYAARGERRGTIVYLEGGPGGAAISSAGPLSVAFGRLRADHDLVFIDQRGTGRSSPLTCSNAPDGVIKTPAKATIQQITTAVARCGEDVRDVSRFFSTYETVLDVEDVRARLGVDKIIPFGVSYGGQVAGEYARRFPDRVQSLVLDSTSSIEGVDAMGKLSQVALPRVLNEICLVPSCDRFLGPPLQILGRAIEVVEERPLAGMDASDLYALVQASDQDPLLRAELPAALQAATQRDAAPLRRLIRYLSSGGGGKSTVNDIRFLATACPEGNLPWAPDSDPAGRGATFEAALVASQGDYAPFPVQAVASQIGATLCLGWPETPRPPIQTGPERGPDVPVLFLAGREDLRTPLEDQQRLASQYANARVLAVPDVGHGVLLSDMSGCAMRGLRAFLAGRSPAECRRQEDLFELALPAFARLRDVPRPRGEAPAKVGRTATAVDLTLRDAERWAIAAGLGDLRRVPGLRGGSLTVLRRGVLLERYEVVGGVRVTGLLKGRGSSFTVTGTGATGTLTLRKGRLKGTLGGRTVTYRPLAAGASARA